MYSFAPGGQLFWPAMVRSGPFINPGRPWSLSILICAISHVLFMNTSSMLNRIIFLNLTWRWRTRVNNPVWRIYFLALLIIRPRQLSALPVNNIVNGTVETRSTMSPTYSANWRALSSNIVTLNIAWLRNNWNNRQLCSLWRFSAYPYNT